MICKACGTSVKCPSCLDYICPNCANVMDGHDCYLPDDELDRMMDYFEPHHDWTGPWES